jgi:uncharacterized protein YcnI
MTSTIRRLAACTAAASLGLLFGATAASAHVIVEGEGVKGESATLTFRVPTESDTASTTQLVVQMPQDHPLGSVRPQTKPGWTATMTMRTIDPPVEVFGEPVSEVVDTITWTGGKVPPGEFDTFVVRVGPLPESVDELVFPAIQTYDDGTTADWIELTEEGAEEPEHPAPVLQLIDAPAEGEEDGATATTAPADERAEAPGASPSVDATEISDLRDDADQAKTLATGGIVVGLIGIVAAIAALVLSRKSSPVPAPTSASAAATSPSPIPPPAPKETDPDETGSDSEGVKD